MANNTLNAGSVLKNGQFGQYVILRHLASGGFGNTYLAQRVADKLQVAIKEFFMSGVNDRDATTSRVTVSNSDSEPMFRAQLDKFKKEAGRVAIMRNEHIVRLYDYFEENDTAYYVMEYVDGQSLGERLKALNHALPENEVANYFMQVLEALAEVHGKRIWHLDIKPGNILITKNGVAKLIDFGASKQLNMAGQVTRSAMCYTPGYAPVEQVAEEMDKFGPWTDFYALGATLYNLLTGLKPPSTSDITERGMAAFRFPPNVSNRMKNMIFWLMRPNRGERPQSVAQVRQAWHSGMAHPPRQAQQQPRQAQQPRHPQPGPRQGRVGGAPMAGRASQPVYHPSRQPQSRGYASPKPAKSGSNKTLFIVLGVVAALVLGALAVVGVTTCGGGHHNESSTVSTDYGFDLSHNESSRNEDGSESESKRGDKGHETTATFQGNLVDEVNAMRASADGGVRMTLSGNVGISAVSTPNHVTMYHDGRSATGHFYGTFSYRGEDGSIYTIYAKADPNAGTFYAEDYSDFQGEMTLIGEYRGICEAEGQSLTATGEHTLPDGDTERFKLVFTAN